LQIANAGPLCHILIMAIQARNSPREHMLQSQILTGHVLDPRILGALMHVAREQFVPESLAGAAYVDAEVPLADGRFLMEPLVFARILEYAAIEAHETVLDVGCGMGYSAAVLSDLARKVVAVEEGSLSAQAKTLLASYPNIEFLQGPLAEGMSQSAPYDVIVIEGAIEILPPPLADQLCEGGRLLAVEHNAGAKVAAVGLGRLVEYKKLRGGLYKRVLCDANAALLPQFRKPQVFSI